MTVLSPPTVMMTMTTDERRVTLALISVQVFSIFIILIRKFMSDCLVAESDNMPKLRQAAFFWLR